MTTLRRARTVGSLTALGVLFALPACDFSNAGDKENTGGPMAAGGSGTGGTAPVEAGGSGGLVPSGAGGAALAGNPTDASVPEDVTSRVDASTILNTAFPAGPYGLKVGETMADHAFVDRDGKPISLSDLRSRAGTKVILWSSGAEWCSVCKGEVRKLKELHITKARDGLVVFESLHESANRTPANLDTLKRWDTLFGGISYALAVEKSPPYANHANTNPYVWIINAHTMKILSLETYAQGDVYAAVNAALTQVK